MAAAMLQTGNDRCLEGAAHVERLELVVQRVDLVLLVVFLSLRLQVDPLARHVVGDGGKRRRVLGPLRHQRQGWITQEGLTLEEG